jgi:hypothetical protein
LHTNLPNAFIDIHNFPLNVNEVCAHNLKELDEIPLEKDLVALN